MKRREYKAIMSRDSQASTRSVTTSRHQDTALSKMLPDEVLAKHFRADNQRGIAICLDQLKNPRYIECIKKTECLVIVVQLLRCENYQIIDKSLSLLADVCLMDDIRMKIRDSKIALNVVRIIENTRNRTLHCRACRLISNLSKSRWHAESLCNVGVLKALKAILTSTTEIKVYCMAIRAVRNIWIYYKNIREKMIELEMIKVIAYLFVTAESNLIMIQHTEDSYTTSNTIYRELLDSCLKAMSNFLATLDSRCGNQMMHVDKNMSGYKCLMRCCSIGNNKMAIKCFYFLCNIAKCRLDLGVSGTVEELIALINKANTNSNVLCKEILFSLCLFCRESVNRDRIRQSKGLQIILSLLNKPEHKHYHLKLLETLALFLYDKIGLEILTKHGILKILVEKLTYVTTYKNSEKNSISKKRPCDDMIESNEDCYKRPSKRSTSRYSMDYRDDWSPSSATSASSSSSPSTPPLPQSEFNIDLDDLEDDVYSPVYSDTECDNNEDEEAASPKSCKSLTTVEADSDSSSSNSETHLETNSCEYYTLLLLNELSLSETPNDKFAESTTIKSLMDYIKCIKKQNSLKNTAIKILIRIMGNAKYFTSLLKQGLVFDMQILPETEEYAQYLCTVAETGGATGELSFILLRGEEEYKLLTAVSIPLLVKTRYNLKNLLKKHGGLELIFRLLADPSHKFHERAVWSICQLARTLEMYSAVYTSSKTTTRNDELCEELKSFSETNCTKSSMANKSNRRILSSKVTFRLDDRSTITACRQMLCQCSPVFSVMLEGNFKESRKERIRLRNTSHGGLKTLLLAAKGAASTAYTFKNRNIESLLDAVLLADYFLMPHLVDTLTENCINKLNYKNFCQAWCWARNKSCDEFKSYCLKRFLTAKMSWNETMRSFRDFYDTDVFKEFLKEVKVIITDALTQC